MCRHPLGSGRCFSHTHGSTDSHHLLVNDSQLAPTPNRRTRSLPPTLEVFAQDAQRHEQIANGIVVGASADNPELSEPAATNLLDGDLPTPMKHINGGGVPYLSQEATHGIGGWCPSPP